MMTQGQSDYLHQNINSFLGITLVASVSFGFSIMIWQAAFDENVVATAIAHTLYKQQLYEQGINYSDL